MKLRLIKTSAKYMYSFISEYMHENGQLKMYLPSQYIEYIVNTFLYCCLHYVWIANREVKFLQYFMAIIQLKRKLLYCECHFPQVVLIFSEWLVFQLSLPIYYFSTVVSRLREVNVSFCAINRKFNLFPKKMVSF